MSYRVSTAQNVKLTVHDVSGRQVRTLVDGATEVGTHRVVWDGRNDAGIPVGTGTYIYQLRTKDVVQSRKLTLMK